ncbi:MAG: hypothetical protein ACSHW4_17285 [Cellulophaga sp.]|uniref:hypothetical protein n=1 Tax=Cellulophaga sp. RHA19 TaxID=1798237 RepID=UPI000C2C3651|nr:hypothetical protein [Cellulophaga sp. RHA19]PKB44901.1 hypothetical protein AX016_3133 [Cellulophaga sp. RHA19]
MKTPILFVKFGQKDHIEALQNKGLLYLNTVDFFKKLESEQGTRGDLLEGATEIRNVLEKDKSILTINPGAKSEIKINLTKAQIRQFYNYKGNIFSLFSIFNNKEETQVIEFDKSMKTFGETALIITNVNEFLKRLKLELEKQKFKFIWGIVDYYNENERNLKELDIFSKASTFQNQNEFRVYVENVNNKPLKIEIGSIKEISYIIESEKLTKLKIERIKR